MYVDESSTNPGPKPEGKKRDETGHTSSVFMEIPKCLIETSPFKKISC